MSESKQRVVVICPGRGTYNKEELGYLQRHHADRTDIIELVDAYRASVDQPSISSLDSMEKFSMRLHTAGENASALIYACALADYQAINQDKYDIVAVTGNSMGWYIALAVSQALNQNNAIKLINTMGSMMADGVIGGQLIYPIIDDNWHIDPDKEKLVLDALAKVTQETEHKVYVSIYLGGYIVLGGEQEGLKVLADLLPMVQDRYPMNLFNHAAFHTPLLREVSEKAQTMLAKDMFDKPSVPLIDGLGNIWQPYSADTHALYQYTLDTQVVEPYDFSTAVEVAIKEYAPDKLIILGPGATLGGSVAQTLIKHQWRGLTDKAAFIAQQKSEPLILAMGLEDQRQLVL
ncbi:ACP S-malonyltransferase [Thalassotalea fusca]